MAGEENGRQAPGKVDWGMILRQPIPFFTVVITVLIPVTLIILWAFEMRYSGVIDLQDRQLAEYRDRLDVETPIEAEEQLRDLEARLAAVEGRRISDDQMATIRQALTLPPGETAEIIVIAEITCNDCARYAAEFQALIGQVPGWTVRRGMGLGGAINRTGGLELAVPDIENPNLEGRLLSTALTSAGIEFRWVESDDTALNVVFPE